MIATRAAPISTPPTKTPLLLVKARSTLGARLLDVAGGGSEPVSVDTVLLFAANNTRRPTKAITAPPALIQRDPLRNKGEFLCLNVQRLPIRQLQNYILNIRINYLVMVAQINLFVKL